MYEFKSDVFIFKNLKWIEVWEEDGVTVNGDWGIEVLRS